jgi:hypothetical protein
MINTLMLIPAFILGLTIGFIACYFRMTYNVSQD